MHLKTKNIWITRMCNRKITQALISLIMNHLFMIIPHIKKVSLKNKHLSNQARLINQIFRI